MARSATASHRHKDLLLEKAENRPSRSALFCKPTRAVTKTEDPGLRAADTEESVKRIRNPLNQATPGPTCVTTYWRSPIHDPTRRGGAEATELAANPFVGPSPAGTTGRTSNQPLKHALSPALVPARPPPGFKG